MRGEINIPSGFLSDGLGSRPKRRINKIDRLLGRKTSDRGICEAVFLHVFWTIDVSKIDHDWTSHRVPYALEIERTELLPFGNDHHGIGPFHAIVGPSAVGHVG